MPKLNFTKVEHFLEEGMRQITVNRLLTLASISEKFGKPKEEKIEPIAVALVKIHLGWHFKLDRSLFKKLGLDKEKAEKILETPLDEVDTFKKVKEKIHEYVDEFEQTLPEDYNERLVEIAREDSINQRFNTRSHWLPLH